MRISAVFSGAIACSLALMAAHAAAADAGAAPSPAPSGDLNGTIERYQSAIQQEQDQQGPYGRRVGEELLGLGTAYAAAGQHHKAVTTLTRAMYVTRINDGLNSPTQLPILEAIIHQNESLHDWKALDRNFDYLYWVERRNFGDNNARLLPVMERVGHWKLKAYVIETGDSPQQFLQQAGEIFADAAALAEKSFGPADPRVISPLYGVAVANYELCNFYSSLDLREFNGLSRGFADYPGETEDQAYDAERDRQMAMLISYSKGSNAMHRLLDIYKNNPGIPPMDHVLALAHAGDWFLVENRLDDAFNAYAQAYDLLRKSGASPDTIRDTFGEPHALTPAGLLAPLAGTGAGGQGQPPATHKSRARMRLKSYVLTSLDVSARGRPYNVRAVESVPTGDESARRRAVRYVSSMVFRPRIENGQPVETDNFRFHVQVND